MNNSYPKIFFALLSVVALFGSCGKEETISIEEETSQTLSDSPVGKVPFKELPSHIKGQAFQLNMELKNKNYDSKNQNQFGNILESEVNILQKGDTLTSYTMRMEHINSGIYEDNLVIMEDDNGNLKINIIRYEPSTTWVSSYINQQTNFSEFSGRVTVFDDAGNSVVSSSLEDGFITPDNEKNDVHQRTQCVLTDIQYAGLYQNGIFYVYDVTYDIYCYDDGIGGSGGGLGGGGGGLGGGGGGGSGTSGDSGAGGAAAWEGDDSVTSAPVLASLEDLLNDIEDDKIISLLTGKAGCVYEKLINNVSYFKAAIQKFDGEFPVAHLQFVMDDLGNTRAETRAPNGAGNSPDYMITIALNNNLNTHGVDYRPNLMIAKTIAHEVIHAEMYRKLLSVLDNGGNISGVTRQDVLDALNNDFPGMYDYYRRHKNWQHQQMATHYRETIADVLQDFDNNQHSRQFYMDLAWEGLKYPSISTWSSLNQSEKNRINEVINEYIVDNEYENCQK